MQLKSESYDLKIALESRDVTLFSHLELVSPCFLGPPENFFPCHRSAQKSQLARFFMGTGVREIYVYMGYVHCACYFVNTIPHHQTFPRSQISSFLVLTYLMIWEPPSNPTSFGKNRPFCNLLKNKCVL